MAPAHTSRDVTRDRGGASRTIARLVAAALVLAGGIVHLDLYLHGYRHVSNHNLGLSFLANVIASFVIAGALVLADRRPIYIAGIALADGSLVAFAKSRTASGIFGLTERGWQPSPQAALAVGAELAAAILLLALLASRTTTLLRDAPVDASTTTVGRAPTDR